MLARLIRPNYQIYIGVDGNFEELNLSNYSILLLLYIIEYKHSIIELYPEAH